MAIKIGAALRAARKAKGLSLRDLEKPTGMSSSQISQIESGGRADPAFGTVLRIARAIGISLDDLAGLGASGPLPKEQTAQVVAELERLRADSARSSRRIEKLIAVLNAGEEDPRP